MTDIFNPTHMTLKDKIAKIKTLTIWIENNPKSDDVKEVAKDISYITSRILRKM